MLQSTMIPSKKKKINPCPKCISQMFSSPSLPPPCPLQKVIYKENLAVQKQGLEIRLF